MKRLLSFIVAIAMVASLVTCFSVSFSADTALTDEQITAFEKAYADVQGAYTMINQQFVEHECMNYKYVNREDDTGAEGLRKAKLSYRPAFMVEKGDVTEKAQG